MQRMILFLTIAICCSATCALRDLPANFSIGSHRATTSYEKSLANLLVRKKRGFVFFKGSVIVLTQVLSKHIVAKSPRGLIHSSEVDMFYDIPILIDGWKKPLEHLVKPTKGAKKSDQVNEIDGGKWKNVGVINASAIPWERYYKTSHRTNLNHLAWNNREKLNRYYNRKYYLRKPYSDFHKTHYYYPNYQRRNYMQNQVRSKAFNRTKVSFPQYQRPSQRTKSFKPSWNEHREYRERRGIFEHIEGFGKKIGVTLRKCILRAICEIKTELLPEGESLINDVARILFTIPTNHDSKDDDFVQMALDDKVDCARRFMVSCPHSPLQYIFNNFRASGFDGKSPMNESPPVNEEEMMELLKYAK